MENLQNLIKIGRVGGNTSDRPGRVGISCFSLLCTAIPSPYVFQTIINLAVTNTSCFLGTDISKQHHCVVLLLHFTRILWLFLVVACPHTFFFLIYFTRLHVSPCDVLLLLYFRRWRRVIRQCCCITRVVCNWCIAMYSTANDPQNGPQMILYRKWSPKSTANDPERKIGMMWTQVSGSSCPFYYYYNKSD